MKVKLGLNLGILLKSHQTQREKSGVREGCVEGARRMYSGSWWFFGGLQQECPAVHCVTSLVIESTAGKSMWNISAEHLDIIKLLKTMDVLFSTLIDVFANVLSTSMLKFGILAFDSAI